MDAKIETKSFERFDILCARHADQQETGRTVRIVYTVRVRVRRLHKQNQYIRRQTQIGCELGCRNWRSLQGGHTHGGTEG